jgi:hypothetical protein
VFDRDLIGVRVGDPLDVAKERDELASAVSVEDTGRRTQAAGVADDVELVEELGESGTLCDVRVHQCLTRYGPLRRRFQRILR